MRLAGQTGIKALRSLGGLIWVWVVCGFAAVPAFASTITYNLTDVRTSDGFLTFTGYFTLDPATAYLLAFDILSSSVSGSGGVGMVEWTPANSFSAWSGPQSLSVSTCTPIGSNCYTAAVKTHTLFFSVPVSFTDAPPLSSELITHGVYNVIFPNDSAEFQYSVSGTLTMVHNPEPSTLMLLFVGMTGMTGTMVGRFLLRSADQKRWQTCLARHLRATRT